MTRATYFDHDGNPTNNPTCELGMCEDCLEESFATMRPIPVPALSTLDPRYKTDPEYQAEVIEAWKTFVDLYALSGSAITRNARFRGEPFTNLRNPQ